MEFLFFPGFMRLLLVAEREHSTWNLKTFKVHAEMDAGKIQYSAWAQLQGSQGK